MDAICTMAIIITVQLAFSGKSSNAVFKSWFVVLVNGALYLKIQSQDGIVLFYMGTCPFTNYVNSLILSLAILVM